jgi:serine/threonine protein kinase
MRLINDSNRKVNFEDDFEVLETLGIGSFGEVYRVRSLDDGQDYAIKKLKCKYRGERDRLLKLAEVERNIEIYLKAQAQGLDRFIVCIY